jgi:hypothetical protein
MRVNNDDVELIRMIEHAFDLREPATENDHPAAAAATPGNAEATLDAIYQRYEEMAAAGTVDALDALLPDHEAPPGKPSTLVRGPAGLLARLRRRRALHIGGAVTLIAAGVVGVLVVTAVPQVRSDYREAPQAVQTAGAVNVTAGTDHSAPPRAEFAEVIADIKAQQLRINDDFVSWRVEVIIPAGSSRNLWLARRSTGSGADYVRMQPIEHARHRKGYVVFLTARRDAMQSPDDLCVITDQPPAQETAAGTPEPIGPAATTTPPVADPPAVPAPSVVPTESAAPPACPDGHRVEITSLTHEQGKDEVNVQARICTPPVVGFRYWLVVENAGAAVAEDGGDRMPPTNAVADLGTTAVDKAERQLPLPGGDGDGYRAYVVSAEDSAVDSLRTSGSEANRLPPSVETASAVVAFT